MTIRHMKKRTWVWVARHNKSYDDNYIVYVNKAKPDIQDGIFVQTPTGPCRHVCANNFQKVFGIKLKPGQLAKVDFSARIIE